VRREPPDLLVSDKGLPPGSVDVMEYVRDVLVEIGLEPKLEITHGPTAYFGRILPPAGGEPGTFAGTPRHPNVFLSGWIADYLGARNFIEPQFACGEAGFANGHGWCDEMLNERMDEASASQVTDRGAANRALGEIEHQLVDAGVQAPITNPLRTHAVSDRVENVQVHLQLGLMLSLIWTQ
jgi:peptide/nickel transport system substrate-binding protein